MGRVLQSGEVRFVGSWERWREYSYKRNRVGRDYG